MNLSDEVAVQRRIRGWTQEDLAHRTGLSVRTIRNVELGVVRNPRRSSIALLARILGIGHQLAHPADRVAEIERWRGTRPPSSPLIDNRSGNEQLVQLVHTVKANRLTTFVGPAGVGKTRLALGVAAELGTSFRDGIAVVELGDLAAEHVTGRSQEAAIAARVREAIGPDETLADSDLLLILDTGEHLPAGTIAVARNLLNSSPGVHLVITARRRLTDRLGVNREIQPLPADPPSGGGPARAPAVDFLLVHSGVDSAAAERLLTDLPSLAELCRRLGGIPRYLEFAAERMRTVPVRHLLACGPSLDMLSTSDPALLPHQRSAAASISWELGLLPIPHRRLLARMAARTEETFTFDDMIAEYGRLPEAGIGNPLTLTSELIDCTLVQPDAHDRHRYRLGPYVSDFVREHGIGSVRDHKGAA
jgi:transcriptional regulator with XRE-family HTH domain